MNHDKITERFLNEAYLKLGDTSLIQVNNPLLTNTDLENPALEILDLMRNPDYLGWSIKTLFNIDLLPFQTAVIRELWVRTFPMLVASRGAGKSFILSVYPLLRALFMPRRKIIVVGAAFL